MHRVKSFTTPDATPRRQANAWAALIDEALIDEHVIIYTGDDSKR